MPRKSAANDRAKWLTKRIKHAIGVARFGASGESIERAADTIARLVLKKMTAPETQGLPQIVPDWMTDAYLHAAYFSAAAPAVEAAPTPVAVPPAPVEAAVAAEVLAPLTPLPLGALVVDAALEEAPATENDPHANTDCQLSNRELFRFCLRSCRRLACFA